MSPRLDWEAKQDQSPLQCQGGRNKEGYMRRDSGRGGGKMMRWVTWGGGGRSGWVTCREEEDEDAEKGTDGWILSYCRWLFVWESTRCLTGFGIQAVLKVTLSHPAVNEVERQRRTDGGRDGKGGGGGQTHRQGRTHWLIMAMLVRSETWIKYTLPILSVFP